MNYDSKMAFSRNLGWITEAEAQELAKKKVAIAGMGGVGGHYCEVMARLGVRNFHIADLDYFELPNFNRQNSSGVSTVNKMKTQVLKAKILDINPEAQITVFEQGVTLENMDEFLNGVDLYLDGLDFFVLDIRFHMFESLRKKGIPGITVAPVGMGAALAVFTSESMSFAEHFGYRPEMSKLDKALRFLVGITPTMIHRKYNVDQTRIDFEKQKVPSTIMGCYLCGGVAGTTALKLLLKRGEVKTSPWVLQYDAYLQTYKKTYILWGSKNPMQRLKLNIMRRLLQKSA